MYVKVYSDDGNLLFNENVGSTRACDGNTCYVEDVVNALRLALRSPELIQPDDESSEAFQARRTATREANQKKVA